MSEKDPDATFDEPELLEDENTADAEETASSRGVAWNFIAITVSVLALPAVGWLLWNDLTAGDAASESDAVIARLEARLDSSRETITALDARLAELAAENDALKQDIDGVSERLIDPTALLGNLPGRTSALERGLASLQGVSAGTRDNWLLAEAEYFLQIANAQLQLADNPALASAALQQADQRMADLSNPAYTEVRSVIADEIARLDSVNTVDITGLSMTLASLSRVVDTLPVQRIGEDLAPEDDAAIDAEESGPARAWSAVKETLSGAIKVTSPEEAGSPLLTLEAETLLRSNLSLQLQSARLALLKGEREIFDQSLDDIDNLLVNYFDVSEVPVQSARETIAEMRINPALQGLPDISGSLNLLRQYRVLEQSSGE
ncbi:MAG: uroporphyrinogen-III C-methyltransferase [Pseudomonadota bacterium]